MKCKYEVELIKKEDSGDNRVTLYFNVPEGFNWEPSAHISLALEGYDRNNEFDKDYIRKFSINTLMEDGVIGITTRTDSSDSMYKKRVAAMEPGEKCTIIESGCRLPIRRENKGIVFISMGIGMSTIRPLINTVIKNQEGITSITNICVNKTDNYLYKDELGASDHIVCNSKFCHHRNDLRDTIDALNEIENNIFYVVGSREFVQNMVTILKEHNVSKKDIMIDKKAGILDGLYEGLSYDEIKKIVREREMSEKNNKK